MTPRQLCVPVPGFLGDVTAVVGCCDLYFLRTYKVSLMEGAHASGDLIVKLCRR